MASNVGPLGHRKEEDHQHTNQAKDLVKPSELESPKFDVPSCAVCIKLLNVIHGRGDRLRLGSRSELLSSRCQYHQRIFSRLYKTCAIWNSREKAGITAHRTSTPSLVTTRADAITLCGYGLLESYSRDGLKGCGRIIDPNWVDLSLLQSWESECTNSHQDACHTQEITGTRLKFRPGILIDVCNLCLVKSIGDEPYVALSYVWGDAPTLRTTSKNIKALQKTHALEQYIASSEVPITVVHTMHLVRILEMRYLWVDALCIEQDANISKQHQIQNMPSIYANAWLTIVAAEGNHANHGIRGIRGVSEPRCLDQHTFKLPDQTKICEIPFSKIEETTWYERGWTYQEYMFSRRLLFFGGSRVRWGCRKHILQEDLNVPIDPKNGVSFLRRPMFTTFEDTRRQAWPKLGIYTHLVRAYNPRHFTYAKDANSAFAGICSVLLSSFDGGFLHGLPEMFFDIALLWQSQRTLERRIASAAPPTDKSDTMLPSWSWMGWRGDIDFSNWKSGSEFVKKGEAFMWPTSVHMIGTVDWYTGCAGTDPNKWRKIDISRQRYAAFMNHSEGTLPLGWSRHPFNFEDLPLSQQISLPEKRSCTTIFKYSSEPKAEFWYPIPTPTEIKEKRVLQPQTDLLYCRTSRAWLYASLSVLRGDGFKGYPAFSFRDEYGKWIGFLSPHASEDARAIIEGGPLPLEEASPRKCALELIAISRGYKAGGVREYGFLEFNLEDSPDRKEHYEFYNVLWIEWIEGIAYRKGIGRVLRDAWESECEEGVDVILG